MFSFKGDMILSKSWLNRAQIIYYFANRPLPVTSDAEDVKHLKAALLSAGKTTEYQLGQGGTSFRFFVFLISRLEGRWKVFADKQLLTRPQIPLSDVLKQLGVQCVQREDHFEIESRGWGTGTAITCDAGLSSQFVSGLLLSCWRLSDDLTVYVPKPVKSEEYLKMTLELLKAAGMNLQISENISSLSITVAKGQQPEVTSLVPEADISSAFSLAAAAVVNGSAEILNWPRHTSQPDLAFLKAFDQMNIKYSADDGKFKIEKHNTWAGCEMEIGNSPDLFPVLSALCALGEGKSRIFGAEHLKVKESDRLAKTAELLRLCGTRFEELSGGMVIYGRSFTELKKPVTFDPSGDHRMAMAAGLFKLFGFNIQIQNRNCVAKSYPNFWSDVGL